MPRSSLRRLHRRQNKAAGDVRKHANDRLDPKTRQKLDVMEQIVEEAAQPTRERKALAHAANRVASANPRLRETLERARSASRTREGPRQSLAEVRKECQQRLDADLARRRHEAWLDNKEKERARDASRDARNAEENADRLANPPPEPRRRQRRARSAIAWERRVIWGPPEPPPPPERVRQRQPGGARTVVLDDPQRPDPALAPARTCGAQYVAEMGPASNCEAEAVASWVCAIMNSKKGHDQQTAVRPAAEGAGGRQCGITYGP